MFNENWLRFIINLENDILIANNTANYVDEFISFGLENKTFNILQFYFCEHVHCDVKQ